MKHSCSTNANNGKSDFKKVPSFLKKTNYVRIKYLFFILFLFTLSLSYAQDRVFAYTYQSNVLNSGQKELEIWTTMNTGREHYFKGFKNRLEFEIGLGKKIQTAFYLNNEYQEGIGVENGSEYVYNNNRQSFSNEWKLKLSDPVANRLGTALYFEYTLAPLATELEGKLIFDKQAGNIIQAINIVGEFEFEKEFENEGNEIEVETEKETAMELNYGLSCKLKENLFLGLEILNQNEITGSEVEHSILLAGAGFSYSTKGFWINFSILPQVTDFILNKQDLTDHERIQGRLIFAYEF